MACGGPPVVLLGVHAGCQESLEAATCTQHRIWSCCRLARGQHRRCRHCLCGLLAGTSPCRQRSPRLSSPCAAGGPLCILPAEGASLPTSITKLRLNTCLSDQPPLDLTPVRTAATWSLPRGTGACSWCIAQHGMLLGQQAEPVQEG